MLNVNYAECHYAEYHYAEYHYAEYHYAECPYRGGWTETLNLKMRFTSMPLPLANYSHNLHMQQNRFLSLLKAFFNTFS